MSLDDVEILSTSDLSQSKYIQPMRLKYRQAGIEKIWDYLRIHNSVAVLIFNVTSQSIVLVRQFRPAVYMGELATAHANGLPASDKIPGSCGVTYELCAGLIDRIDEEKNIACSEVLEETGYQVTPEKLQLISKFRSGVGVTGSLQHMYYVEVTDEMKVGPGGGKRDEGEMIELYNLKLADVKSFLYDTSISNRPAGLLLALSWFLANKANSSS